MIADVHTREQRSPNISRIKGCDTKPEIRLRSLLHRAGYRLSLHATNLPARPDIVMPKRRAMIFVNGCYWRRHKGCRFITMPATRPYFWQKKFEDTTQRDERNRDLLEKSGWRVIKVWERELKGTPKRTLDQITKLLRGQH